MASGRAAPSPLENTDFFEYSGNEEEKAVQILMNIMQKIAFLN